METPNQIKLRLGVKVGQKEIRLISLTGERSSYDEAELEAAIDKGTKAWAHVPDSVAWLKSIREGADE